MGKNPEGPVLLSPKLQCGVQDSIQSLHMPLHYQLPLKREGRAREWNMGRSSTRRGGQPIRHTIARALMVCVSLMLLKSKLGIMTQTSLKVSFHFRSSRNWCCELRLPESTRSYGSRTLPFQGFSAISPTSPPPTSSSTSSCLSADKRWLPFCSESTKLIQLLCLLLSNHPRFAEKNLPLWSGPPAPLFGNWPHREFADGWKELVQKRVPWGITTNRNCPQFDPMTCLKFKASGSSPLVESLWPLISTHSLCLFLLFPLSFLSFSSLSSLFLSFSVSDSFSLYLCLTPMGKSLS